MSTRESGLSERPALRFAGAAWQSSSDAIVVEEPLEIRVADDPVGITMRTPGDDSALALGWLFAEGVIASVADVGSVAHCGKPTDDDYGNVLNVTPGPGAKLAFERLEAARRIWTTTSACGVCGRRSIDDLLSRVQPVGVTSELDARLMLEAPALLAARQPRFARSGGLHGALALTASGRVLASAEDIGRHNATDKVIGTLLRDGALPRQLLEPSVLFVSGRLGFEIAQKAAVAGFAVVAGVSAASSLAIDTAAAFGITLIGFVRDGRFSIYSHPERIRGAQ